MMSMLKFGIALALSAVPGIAAAAPAGRLEVTLTGLRNGKGDLLLCLTRNSKHFPDCNADPEARKLVVPAKGARTFSFDDLPPGNYAFSLFHDENRNRKLDTMMAFPREGFGFSRNPKVRFGPPSFSQVAFQVGSGSVTQIVKMQYLL